MTCRHQPGDRSCTTQFPPPPEPPRTPDAKNYRILEAERVSHHLVLKVKYPNCAKCAYEGVKVLVFLNVTETDALKWREIDPHFRPKTKGPITEAPGPAARFPASEEGWADALTYARGRK